MKKLIYVFDVFIDEEGKFSGTVKVNTAMTELFDELESPAERKAYKKMILAGVKGLLNEANSPSKSSRKSGATV